MNKRTLFSVGIRVMGFFAGLAAFSLFVGSRQAPVKRATGLPSQPTAPLQPPAEVPPEAVLQPTTEVRAPLSLCDAIRKNDVKLVKRLLKEGAEVNAPDALSPLALALRWDRDGEPKSKTNRRIAIVTLLIQHGANPDVWSQACQTTPMHFAVEVHNLALMKLLLARGVNSDFADYNGHTPLLLAVENNDDIAVVRLLLAHGAYPDACVRHSGATALMIAAEEGREDIVRALLKAGADINDTDNHDCSVIQYAVDNHAPAHIIRLLRRWRARKIPIRPMKDGLSGSAWDRPD